MSTTKENNPPAWQRITAKNPPQFIPSGKCFLWDAAMNRVITGNNIWDVESCKNHDITHWHPDQPDAPTSGPESVMDSLTEETERLGLYDSTPQPGPTPDSDLPSMSTPELLELYQQISSRVAMYNTEVLILRMFAIRKELADRFDRLERERDEARRERDALSQAFDKLREQVVTGEAANATLRNEVKINVENGLGLHAQIVTLRQDRDGLAALCEERKAALEATVKFYAEDMPSGPDKADLHCVTKAYRDAYARVLQALALTPASALARQREKEKVT